MAKVVPLLAASAVAVLLAAALLLGSGPSGTGSCAGTSVAAATAATHKPVAGYSGDQLANAAAVINAGAALRVPSAGITIGVMVAMGESGLRNLTYGDTAGPDSRGLFQQRANGAWGSLADRMTPYTAAYNFFAALVAIPSWKTLSPTQAAHAVQINADPSYYSKYWTESVTIVTALNR